MSHTRFTIDVIPKIPIFLNSGLANCRLIGIERILPIAHRLAFSPKNDDGRLLANTFGDTSVNIRFAAIGRRADYISSEQYMMLPDTYPIFQGDSKWA